MVAHALTESPPAKLTYPVAEVRTRLGEGVRKAARNKKDLCGEWDPRLDSMRCVSIIVSLEDLLGELPPEKLVRRGGYANEEDAVSDMADRVERYGKETH